jgi:hypothetical protein
MYTGSRGTPFYYKKGHGGHDCICSWIYIFLCNLYPSPLKFESHSWQDILNTTLCYIVFVFLYITMVSSTIWTDHHDITEILLKMVNKNWTVTRDKNPDYRPLVRSSLCSVSPGSKQIIPNLLIFSSTNLEPKARVNFSITCRLVSIVHRPLTFPILIFF